MARIEFLPKAVQDLQDIWDYTFDTWSEAQADKYHSKLKGACRALADRSVSGRKYELIPASYLGYKAGRHIIIYRVDSPEEITVVRILHGSMDLERRIDA